VTDLISQALRGKRVLLTGHTGFKGSWLSLWLAELGAEVTGYALEPPTSPSNFVASRIENLLARHVLGDVRDSAALAKTVREVDPDAIFHLAAQPLVRESYRDPVTTVTTNIIGTQNLLEGVRLRHKPCAVVVVTSDKCYENRESAHAYRETDPMGGHDPYSMSKGATELLVASWRRSFFPPDGLRDHGVCVATARAGNVIGGGDWQRDRILVDCVRNLEAGQPIELRNPSAIRPWQHVLEPLGGYLLLAARMLTAPVAAAARLADAWNFGPRTADCWPVARLADEVVRQWGSGSWRAAPEAGAPHEASQLVLCCDKAAEGLGWCPAWRVDRAVEKTVDWYRTFGAGGDVASLGRQQLTDYANDASRAWANRGRG
jgi:CDP-glucose 4,6-dehydratase